MSDPDAAVPYPLYPDATASFPDATAFPAQPPVLPPPPVLPQQPSVAQPVPAQVPAQPEAWQSAQPVAWQPAQAEAWQPASPVEHKRTWNRKAAGGAAGGVGVLAKVLISAKAFFVVLKFKTALSMFISIAAYALFWGWPFAIGFVLMMFVHECGHVVVLRKQGVKATAPMFIPFLGAFVKLQGPQRSVAEEATSALAGPAAGLAISGVVLLFANVHHSPLLTALAYTGFFMNLFNLVPALPLDGGRVAGALHPALWFVGMAAVIGWMFYRFSPILVLVLVLGGMEALRRWNAHRRGEDSEYNTLAPGVRWKIAGAYVAVAVLCLAGMGAAYTPMSL